VRQGRRQRACAGRIAIIALATVCAAAVSGAEPATNAWATGGVTGTAAPAGMALPYWQAPALPTAVIQGGAIPPGWSPQAVPYRGTGPDGKPLTVYYAPTYTFTYPIGPPMLAAATIPAASQVNRRQALPVAAQPGAAQGWNYQTQSAAPPAYALPPATVARYQPTPYQFPAGSKQLAGTPVVPPSGPPVTAFTAAPPTYQPAPPPPTQWAASQEPPPPGLAPQTAPPTQEHRSDGGRRGAADGRRCRRCRCAATDSVSLGLCDTSARGVFRLPDVDGDPRAAGEHLTGTAAIGRAGRRRVHLASLAGRGRARRRHDHLPR
jgi:hypothetical protein